MGIFTVIHVTLRCPMLHLIPTLCITELTLNFLQVAILMKMTFEKMMLNSLLKALLGTLGDRFGRLALWSLIMCDPSIYRRICGCSTYWQVSACFMHELPMCVTRFGHHTNVFTFPEPLHVIVETSYAP